MRGSERCSRSGVKFLFNLRAEGIAEPLTREEPLEVIVGDFCEWVILEFAEGHRVGAGGFWAEFTGSFWRDEDGFGGGMRVTQDAEEGDGSGLPLVVWSGWVEGEVGDVGEAGRVHGGQYAVEYVV
jgi:hypothetical protein